MQRSITFPCRLPREKPYSSDENLLHISFEGGILEDPWNEPDPAMFKMTKAPEDAPDSPSYVELDFVQGNPVAINGQTLSPADLFQELNRLGGENGIGRLDMVENRFVGMKSRGVYETPGGTILRTAHRDLETITLDREVLRIGTAWLPVTQNWSITDSGSLLKCNCCRKPWMIPRQQ